MPEPQSAAPIRGRCAVCGGDSAGGQRGCSCPDGPTWGSDAASTYEFRVRQWGDGSAWWMVEMRIASDVTFKKVADVLGQKRAEIVRDALSEEANERV